MSSRFPSNYEALASELLENIEEMVPHYLSKCESWTNGCTEYENSRVKNILS